MAEAGAEHRDQTSAEHRGKPTGEQGPPLILKIGGSLAETGRLRPVLEKIGRARRPIIVVPGGGAFADKVRELQRAIGFDDAQAHRLAMLGMHQMAEVFFALEPRLAPAGSVDGIARVLAEGLIPVWLPLAMCEHDGEIPADWSITSDGLAARLAERMGGAEVVLLKSLTVDAEASASALADDGAVDRTFPAIVARAGLRWRILGPQDDAALDALLGLVPGA